MLFARNGAAPRVTPTPASQRPRVSRVMLRRLLEAASTRGLLVTADDKLAWPATAHADLFRRIFDISERDQETLHRKAAA